MASGQCRSCGAPILWATTEGGKQMPVDEEPSSFGNIILLDLGDGTLIARYVHPASEPTLFEDGPRHTSHFANCPDRKVWRKDA